MTAAALELAAARLRVEATKLEGSVVRCIEPALHLLPAVWVGPAADRLEQELVAHRRVLQTVADGLCDRAGSLEVQAAVIRAAETLPSPEGTLDAL